MYQSRNLNSFQALAIVKDFDHVFYFLRNNRLSDQEKYACFGHLFLHLSMTIEQLTDFTYASLIVNGQKSPEIAKSFVKNALTHYYHLVAKSPIILSPDEQTDPQP